MWLEETAQTNADTKTEDIWLKIAEPASVGKTTEVRLRILDEEPVGTWRHWLGKRPYNCPGMDKCPVCRVRMEASKTDPDGYKNEYRLDYRYFFNVLVDHEVKMFSFTPTVGRKLKTFQQKYGDLRNYDVSVSKRKTGQLSQNVEYDVIFEKEFALSTEDTAIAENRHERTQFIEPATLDVLKQVARGDEPLFSGDTQGIDNPEPTTKSNKPTKADMIALKALVEARNYHLEDFGIVESSPPPKDVIEKLIKGLKEEK